MKSTRLVQILSVLPITCCLYRRTVTIGIGPGAEMVLPLSPFVFIPSIHRHHVHIFSIRTSKKPLLQKQKRA